MLIDAAERVLIAQRPPGTHLAGGWEFPGGKLEPHEERLAGLARELREELGIEVGQCRPLIRVSHSYPARSPLPARDVLLDVWVVKRYGGEPRGLDGQALRWCAMDELPAADLLPADAPIVAALRLPERLTAAATAVYVLHPFSERGEARFDARLAGVSCASGAEAQAAAADGAALVALECNLPDEELAALCAAVPVPVYARGIDLDSAWMLGASGVNGL